MLEWLYSDDREFSSEPSKELQLHVHVNPYNLQLNSSAHLIKKK